MNTQQNTNSRTGDRVDALQTDLQGHNKHLISAPASKDTAGFLKGLDTMTRFSALAALTWFAMCFFFLDASAYAVAMDVLPVAPHATDDMDAARISFLLYTSVPMLLWIYEALRKESLNAPARQA